MNKKNKAINIKNKKSDTNPNNSYDNLSDEFNKLVGNVGSNKKNLIIESDNDISNIECENQGGIDIKYKLKAKNKELTLEESLECIYKDLHAILLSNKLRSIIGELISLKISGNNAYITIRISDYQINCNFWQIIKSEDLGIYKSFKEGDKIRLDGNFSILQKSFSVYFNVKSMSKLGLGDYLALHALNRKKIFDLGWDQNKRTLSKFPYSIGIITSIDGAAIQDILQALKSDNFIGNIIIVNAIVQGKQCPQSIISKINWVETNYPHLDLLMVTRGGGSFEDLVGFSDWDLVTSIQKCKIITLSAVGHQIDNQLSDEVADYKFATPSLGAKFITSLQKDYFYGFKNYKNMLKCFDQKIIESRNKLNIISTNYQNIIFNYDLEKIKKKVYKYTKYVRSKIENYHSAKNLFYKLISNTQSKIIKAGKEVNSVYDIINTSPKKLELVFPDGKVIISYRIITNE